MPEQSLAWQRGKLDCKCNQCGFASAATSRCNRCSSTDLTYLSHAGQVAAGATTSWCGNNLVRPAHLLDINATGGAGLPPSGSQGRDTDATARSGGL